MAAPVLIVDDDPHLREVVRFALQKASFSVVEARDGREALLVFERESPQLVILDITMPEMDGTEVCRLLRTRSRVPIVFLSSRDDELDRILGLELGGDDYLTKPFSPRELVARVKAILRRTLPPSPPTPSRLISHGRLSLDLDHFTATWDGREVPLTSTELGILRTLLRHPGKVFSREELMDGAYDVENVVSDRTIDSHIRRVRRKLGELGGDAIETFHGVGYRIGPCR